MLYLFQTIVYAAICCLFYLLFLKDRPMHRFNRIYLLTCALIPFLLPFIKLNFLSDRESPVNQYMNVQMPEIVVTDAKMNDSISNVFLLSAMIYALVSFSILLVNIYKWIRLKYVIRKAEKLKMQDYTLLSHTGYGPGSWGRYIFLPEADADERIIAHEAAHVRSKHTRDITFLTALQCLFWYNPFLHFIKKELRQVHEFEADAAVQGDTAEYQELLLHHFLMQCQLPFTHSFINHPIKRRIMMLNRNNHAKSYTWSIALTTAAFLFFAGNIIWFQSCKSKKWEVKDETQIVEFPQQGKEGKLSYKAGKMEGEIYTIVDKMPQPTIDLPEFLGQNIRYPEEAKKNKIEGKVVVKFIVDKEGNVTEAKVVKSPNELLSQEALRVISLMPAWIPGENKSGEKVNVYFTQPINFQLDNDNTKPHARNNRIITFNAPGISFYAEEITEDNYAKYLEEMLSAIKNGKTTMSSKDAQAFTSFFIEHVINRRKKEIYEEKNDEITYNQQERNWVCVDEISKEAYDKLSSEAPSPKKIHFPRMPHIPAKIK